MKEYWENICARFQLLEKQTFILQNLLNYTSSYEKFMFEVSVVIKDKLYNHFNKSEKIIFVTEEGKKIIPLVGLHSTTNESCQKILKEGFNSSKGNIYGKVENKEWPVAMFTNPFLNLSKTYSSPRFCGRSWQLQIITLTNGIIRMLRANENEFPIIIAVFKNIGNNLKINGYINSFDNKNIVIIGKIDVKFSNKTLKYMRKEFEKEQTFNCAKHPKLPLDYTINWFI